MNKNEDNFYGYILLPWQSVIDSIGFHMVPVASVKLLTQCFRLVNKFGILSGTKICLFLIVLGCNNAGDNIKKEIPLSEVKEPAFTTKDSNEDFIETPSVDRSTNILPAKVQEVILIDTEIVITPVIIEEVVYSKNIDTCKSKDLKKYTIRIKNEELYLAWFFYYCPSMNGYYDYCRNLGSYNNLVGVTDMEKTAQCNLPLQYVEGSKLMIRAEGYEPYDINLSSIENDSLAELALEPKIYWNNIVLSKKNRKIVFELIPETQESQTFYGECLPISLENGEYADPYCAFSQMGCFYPSISLVPIESVLREYPLEVKKIFRKLRNKNSKYTFIIHQQGNYLSKIEFESWPEKGCSEIKEYFSNASWQNNFEGNNYKIKVLISK